MNLSYIKSMLEMMIASQWKDRYVFLSLTSVMLVQNFIFFSIWVIFFDAFGEIRGWQIEDMATLFGVVAFGFGLAFIFFGGALDLGRIIREGELDTYLGRPKAPLLPVLMREARPASLGDLLTGPMMWFVFGGYGIGDFPILILLGVLSGIVVLSVAISVQSIIFFIGSIRTLPDQIFELFLIGSMYPQHGHGIVLRAALFTVIPAGFAAYMPVKIMSDFVWWQLGLMLFASAAYLMIAVRVFYSGLKRYASGNSFVSLA